MVAADTAGSPDEGVTSGSNSMQMSGGAIRVAAAAARRRLLELAAEQLGVPAVELQVEDGEVRTRDSNRHVTYWELHGDRAFEGDADGNVAVKTAQQYRLRAADVTPHGLVELVAGSPTFVHDLELPDMVHARVVRPPGYHHALHSIDETPVQQMRGVLAIVRDGSFLAVVAEREEQAIAASTRLAALANWKRTVELDDRPLGELLLQSERESFRVVEGVPQPGDVGDAPNPNDAALTVEADYSRPYIMHGSIGPSAAVARFDSDGLHVHCHSQGIYLLRASLAKVLGLREEQVRVSHVPGPGCYGHNGADDVALDAALVARALPSRNVMLKWERADEHAWEPYGSTMLMKLSASLDADNRVVGWMHHVYSDTHTNRPGRTGRQPQLLAAAHLADGRPPQQAQPNMGFHVGLHRNADPLYTFDAKHIVKNLVPGMPLRVSALRSLGAFGNVFAIESFIHEIADACGEDPVDFRLRHLQDPRAREVLERAADAGGWREDRPAGVGRGIGFARYANVKTYAAVLVDLRADDYGDIQLHRALIAADAGQIVDPDGLRLQLEGGFLQAASWTLKEQVTYDRDGITSRDWDGYPILRFADVPDVKIELIDRPGEPSLGAGEATLGPTAAAIANAVFDATGLRLRELPFTAEQVRRTAAA
jgi:CO/xanthine dehydrogenase Mo-binding subunit